MLVETGSETINTLVAPAKARTTLAAVDRAYWANLELSFERRTLGGFHLRVYAGAGAVFAGERQRCSDGDADTMPCSGSARGLRTPYIGLSIGYAPRI